MQREYKKINFKEKEFLAIRGIVHSDYSWNCFYEPEEKEVKDKYWNIKEGDVVFDVGASYGSYALTACAMGAIVFAFEPEKTVFCDLVKNITINKWHSKCFPMNIGMHSSQTKIDMKSYAPHWPAYTISEDYNMDTIDNIAEMSQVERLDWIKIDVEGAEEHVIKGGLKTINKFKPNLIVECHNFLDAELSNKLKTLLSSLSYPYEFEDISRPPCVIIYATSKKD